MNVFSWYEEIIDSEHLSQAFARYFMRVGLPIDIERFKIKEYTHST